jgi:hypothetical protein
MFSVRSSVTISCFHCSQLTHRTSQDKFRISFWKGVSLPIRRNMRNKKTLRYTPRQMLLCSKPWRSAIYLSHCHFSTIYVPFVWFTLQTNYTQCVYARVMCVRVYTYVFILQLCINLRRPHYSGGVRMTLSLRGHRLRIREVNLLRSQLCGRTSQSNELNNLRKTNKFTII